MLQKIVDSGKQLFSVMQKLQKHEEDIKEMRRDNHQLRFYLQHRYHSRLRYKNQRLCVFQDGFLWLQH